jgi:hypothetical protein
MRKCTDLSVKLRENISTDSEFIKLFVRFIKKLISLLLCQPASSSSSKSGSLITLMQKAVSSSETLINIYQTTWYNIPEGSRISGVLNTIKHIFFYSVIGVRLFLQH